LPARPVLQVSLYPDPERWNNLVSKFTARWDLPNDVTDVSTLLDKNPISNPARSEGLFNNKEFPRLEDGVWRLHVRFKNSVGWGPTAHYRLAIDTSPPLPFEIISDEGVSTGIPNPTIRYKTGDALSSVKYLLRIDGEKTIETKEDSYKLPVLKPGKHSIRVQAVDEALNSTEKVLEIDILPISSPTISSISDRAFLGEGDINVSGAALPDVKINLFVRNISKETVYSESVMSDENGGWSARILNHFKKGKYYVAAIAEDERGASSLEVNSDIFTVRERPLFTIGSLEITQTFFVFALLLLILSGIAILIFLYRLFTTNIKNKVVIAQRDVITMNNLILGDAEKVLKLLSANKQGISADINEQLKILVNKIKTSAEKMIKYTVEDIGEID